MGRNASTSSTGAGIAFFDVDGTLTRSSTMHRFLRYYVNRVGRPDTDYRGWVRTVAAMNGQGRPREQINARYFAHFTGADADIVADLAQQWLRAELRTGGFYHEPVLAELRRHRRQGDHIVLVSGALPSCLDAVAGDVGADEICCVELEIVDGRYTGSLAGAPMIGAAKATAATAVIARRGTAAADCSAYGDHISDLPLLRVGGTAVVVGGDQDLCAVAAASGWRVLSAPTPAPELPLLNPSETAEDA
jgi:HAD superfamily hydrolase (TIGR01490 family)